MGPDELKKSKKLLAEHGFIDPSKQKELEEKRRRSGEKDYKKFLRLLKDKLADYADVEKMEINRLEAPVETDYPKPVNAYHLIYESPNASIEEIYYWIYHHLKVDQGFHNIIKIS
ncbi:MAG: hypothetical protein QXG86_01570, partial [Candidatus Woesearchaeota archaeon]